MGGFLTAVPFFIRNVMITGWLVYPFAGIDLFDVDWKIPKWQVEFDATEIGVYGKGLNDVSKQDLPFSEWVPSWFENLKALEKVFIIMTVAAIFAGIIYLVYYIGLMLKYRSYKNMNSKKMLWNRDWDFPLVFMVFVTSAIFWFVSAPLVRYGYAYITVVPLITFGYFFLRLMQSKRIKKYEKILHVAFCLTVIGFLFTRIIGLGNDIARTWKEPYYFVQMDYVNGEAETKVVDGVTFYVPVNAGQIGYEKFPSSVFALPFELRGDSIEDGFRQIPLE